MESLPWSWLFWVIVVAVAIRMLLNQVVMVRDKLRQNLVDHFQGQIGDVKRKRAIARVQEKVRRLKELDAQDSKKILKAATAEQASKKSA